ncbi:uncharacterized protein LOC119377674 [Rhipicephalus sanguineus]|uniref:uncharacterized protein LOC119377674 n=1 Tax=Rhipicephalus sanguineus TaxID=34632 RepID=UPI0018949192|nr:uncharacterized protein LOC119377674 [Rhipicephalus sanguineus]
MAVMKSCFARFGVPSVVVADNGPQFASEAFKDFSKAYGFSHVTSSPRYAQANGEVERMVRRVKDMFLKSKDIYLALLTYRDTPSVTGYSPTQLLMGRPLKTTIPKIDEALAPKWPSIFKVRKKDRAARKKQARNFNRHHAVRELRPLMPGDDVWVQDIPCVAKVLSPAQRPRSYIVETSSGVIQRNRKHLVPFDPTSGESTSSPSEDLLSEPVDVTLQDELGDSTPSPEQEPLGTTSCEERRDQQTYRTQYGRVVRKPERLDFSFQAEKGECSDPY